MKDIIWLFPLLFIFHDLEEIIGFMPWIERNEKLLAKKAAFILNTHKGLSTEGFALAVAEGICRGIPHFFLCSFLPHPPTLSHLAGRICGFCSSFGGSYPASYLA